MARGDLIVIGAGPGGVAAASAAAERGRDVTLVSDGRLLGYGLWGAYRSKGLWELAGKRRVALSEGFGYPSTGADVDWNAIHEQLDEGIEDLIGVHRRTLELEGVRIVEGRARFVDPHAVEVEGQRLEADALVIATGSGPRTLPDLEVDGRRVFTSDEIVDVREGFGSLLVIGAGVIGCEFASIFSAFGVDVTLLDRAPRLMGHEDEDLSAFVTQELRDAGVDVRSSARTKRFEQHADGVRTELEDGTVFDTDAILLAIGRVPSSAELGLEAAGIETDRRGAIPVDERMRTNVRHVYAIGDVGQRNTPLDIALVHVAEREGRLAARDVCGEVTAHHGEHVPYIVFTRPMTAGAGITETQARERHGEIRVARFANARNHRHHAMRSFGGFVKLVVGPEGDDRVLGVRAVGEGADTVIGEVSVLIDRNVPYTYLLDSVHAHPSLGESLQGAARVIAGLLPPEV